MQFRLMSKFPLMRLLLLFLCLSFSGFGQSPWVKSKGEGYAQIGFTSIANYASLYDKETTSGTRRLDRRMSDRTISAYGEYGLNSKWTLLTTVPLKWLTSGELLSSADPASVITESGDLVALGNVEIGAKYGFYQKSFVASAQLKIGANTQSFDNSTGLLTGIPAWTAETLASIGKGGKNYYFFGYGGLGFRTNNYSSYGRFGIEAGIDIKKRIWFVGFIDAVFSFRNGSVVVPPTNFRSGMYLNDQEYIAFGPKIIFEAIREKLGFTLSAAGGVSNNNVPVQLASSAGIYYKWN